MSDDLVLYESNDRMATITINRAERMNTLSNATVGALRDAFIRYQESEDRCAIVTGAGERSFSAGADIKDPPVNPELWEAMPGVGVMVDKPIIAAVSGYCVGGAYVLVQLSDIAVASETADFFYPEAQIGFCGGLIASAAARIPHKIAMEFMLTGVHFDAQRAYEVGMINKVVPLEQVLPEAKALAARISANAPLAVQASKAVLDQAYDDTPENLYQASGRAFMSLTGTEDFAEGPMAFIEKRPAVWKGR